MRLTSVFLPGLLTLLALSAFAPQNAPNTDEDEIPVLAPGHYLVLGFFESTRDTILKDTFSLERNGDHILMRPFDDLKFKNPLYGVATDDRMSVHSKDEAAFGGGVLFFNVVVNKNKIAEGHGAMPKKNPKVFNVRLERIAIPLIDRRDGERYATIRIGNQFWMAENLRYNMKYAENLRKNDNDTVAKGVFYNTDNPDKKYGCLYTWEAVQDACPAGWRVPTREDWNELIDYLGPKIAGTKLKSATGWGGQVSGGKDLVGFSAFPAGYFNPETQTFKDLYEHTFFWSIDQHDVKNSWYRNIYHEYPGVYEFNDRKEYGLSCRCIQQ